MNTNKRTGVFIAILVVAAVVLGFFQYKKSSNETPGNMPTDTVVYACSANKSITAAYYPGSVSLIFGDGRTMALTQTVSVDPLGGARYSNAGETAVFWQKGNGITFTEGSAQTYMGCVRVAEDSGGLPLVYSNGSQGFSIRYPSRYAIDDGYKYQALGPGNDIGGVKFTIPASVAAGTNLSTDSYLSVEEIANASNCSAALFLEPGAAVTMANDGGVTYSVASTVGAAAGNRYDETVYAIPGTNPCMAVRYMMHYGVFENYPAGSVREFDKAALKAEFDAMRRTLVVLAQ